tara:strand:- start:5049 stop:5453 length:405 start_codon:yes stop_codon:yes gene_type:complete
MVRQQNIPDTVPMGFLGSLPEFVVLQTLLRMGFREDVDFVYQSSRFGGRLEKGGLIIDFTFSRPPDLAINVQGEYYHHEQGPNVVAKDKYARAQLAGQGIMLIFIDAEDVLDDPERHVRDALRYKDNSFLGGLG